ncbi:MAG: type II secretion system F family protein [Thermodesulfobacteriota bacterium]
MSFFRFRLLEQTGRITGGIINLPYREVSSAVAHLERDGGAAIYVKKLGRAATFLLGLATYRPRRRIPRTLQAEFLRMVAMMLRSGLILTTALQEAALSSEVPEFEYDIAEIIKNIQGGVSLSEAAAQYSHIFPRTVIHLIRIGEETGRLDAMLEDASEHLTRVNNIITDTKQALLYPSMVFLALLGALIFWFYYVVPKITGLFKEMDVTLPAITVLLLQVSNLVQAYIVHLILSLVLAAFAFAFLRKGSPAFRKFIDALLLKLPLVGTIVSASSLAFISEYFYILLNAGLDLLQSMTILRESVNNQVYAERLEVVKESMTQGRGVAESFTAAVIFPTFVIRMINTGELSGTLPEQLSYIADNYRRTLSNLVATISKMIEPIVLVVAGTIFAVIIGGLMLPIYDLVGRISR